MSHSSPFVGGLVVCRSAEQKGEIIARHPSATHPLGAQLVVEPEEVAVFLRDGAAVGVVPPGHHVLHPGQLPFLQMLVAPGTHQLPAMIAFVTVAPVHGCRFGGPAGSVVDPGGRVAQVMLFGEYSMRVADPMRFIDVLAGANGDSERIRKWVGDQILTRLRNCLGEWVVAGYFAVDTLANAGPQLAQAVGSRCGDLAEQGLEVLQIGPVTARAR